MAQKQKTSFDKKNYRKTSREGDFWYRNRRLVLITQLTETRVEIMAFGTETED